MSAPDGPHLAFPFRVGDDGRTAQVQSLESHVRDELIQLIMTNPGERAFLPEFGGGARRLVFEAADDTTAAMAKALISQAMSRWLGERITLEDLTVETVEGGIDVDLKYRIASTQDQRRIRFQKSGG